MKRILLNLGLALAGLVLALAAIEAVFRLARWSGTSVAAKSDRPSFYYMPESATSLQDAGHSWQPAPNTYRVLVLGDSISFAPYMQFDDTFSKRLERMLNLNTGSRTVEVLNLGVPGVSTIHEAKTLEEAVKRKPDLVLLQITLNDLQEKPFSKNEFEWAKRFGPLRFHGRMKQLTRYWQSLGYLLKRVHAARTQPAYVAYYLQLLAKPENRAQVEAGLTRIAALRDKYHFSLAAVLFPLFGVSLDETYPFQPLHQYFRDQLAARSIPVLDLLNTFEGLPQIRLQVIPDKDLHPGEIAHRLAAERIYEWLEQEKAVPEEFLIRRRFKQRVSQNFPSPH